MRPYDFDGLYSKIELGNMQSPGVVTLSGHDRIKKWDVKSAKGQQGASTALNGDDPGKFQAEFYLVSDDTIEGENGATDFDLWSVFQRLIESTTNGPKPVALPIYHPDLALNGFTEVTNGGVGGLIHDGKGGARVKVTFIEYKPAKPKTPAKATSKPGSTANGKANAPDPNAAAKAELAALLAEAKKP